jgi:heme-degrading monooxygenase HmoA
MLPQILEHRPFVVKPKTQRLVLFMVVMTAMMGIALAALLTLRDYGLRSDFLHEWWTRFIGTYVFVVPTVLLVSPLANWITDFLLGSAATISMPDEATPPPADPIIHDTTSYWGETARQTPGQVMLVNLFTPQPGMADAFVKTQSAEYVRLAGKVDGFVANRLGRAIDCSDRIVNVAIFENIEAYAAWRDSQLFRDHMDIIRPLVQSSAPGMYTVVYDSSGSSVRN